MNGYCPECSTPCHRGERKCVNGHEFAQAMQTPDQLKRVRYEFLTFVAGQPKLISADVSYEWHMADGVAVAKFEIRYERR